MKLIQFIVASVIFVCVLGAIVVHGFCTRSIGGLGWLLAGGFLTGAYVMVRASYEELRDDLKR